MKIKKNKKQALIILIGLFVLNVFAWSIFFDLSQPQFLEVIFFDVGQGDATLIKTPENHLILIDGGPSSIILEKLAQETNFLEREIDLIVLTHFHSDHYFGLKKVIENYNVKKVLWNGVIEETPAFNYWQKLISESETETITALAGQRIKGESFSIDVLYPLVNLEGVEFKDNNLSSIVLRLVFQDSSFLFMGDAYKSIEKELIAQESFCQENFNYFCQTMVLNSNVLKVGHHGSKTSSAEEFVKAVSPEIAIISSGKNNRYGHPHQETLDVFKKYDIFVLRTDLNGDIKIISNGEKFKIIKN